ncbi:MAG: deoxynucleoside kinase [Bacteroidota bacterium]|nr:deoxynucleoside kinase [Bacteroidota bacterium]
MLVTIAGNIGSGKSTLTLLLHQAFGWQPHFESVDDNPYLEDFYADMARWSFHLQVYFLSRRFITHKRITEWKGDAVQDRSIYEDAEIFAKNLFATGKMDERDYRNYRALYDVMIPYLRLPDLLVYLRADVDTLQKQIALRGRPFERDLPRAYLEQLNTLYEEWVARYPGKLITIDVGEIDFVHDNRNQEKLLHEIRLAARPCHS